MDPSIAKEKLLHYKITDWNIGRVKFCARIGIILELFLLVRNIYYFGISFHYYVQLYLAMLLASGLVLLGSSMIEKIKEQDRKYRYVDRMLFAYYLFTLLWGVTITLLDQSSYGQVTAYLINLLIACTLFLNDTKVFMKLHVLPVAVLLIGFICLSPSSSHLSGHLINIGVFWIFAAFSARTLYNYIRRSFEQELLLNERNQELRGLVNDLEISANNDYLTKIPNRNYLYRCLREHLHNPRRVTVMMIDIDFFKMYNDNFGHPKGDEVLVAVATCIDQAAKQSGMQAARLGGEEFIVVGFDMDERFAGQMAERLLQGVESLQIKTATNSNVTISVGYVTSLACTLSDIDDLMGKADHALYDSKTNGRNRVTHYA